MFGIGKRHLQRLFNRYVGVSPKWVIQRYRLHEVLEQIKRDETVDWAELAQDLGYFDQATSSKTSGRSLVHRRETMPEATAPPTSKQGEREGYR